MPNLYDQIKKDLEASGLVKHDIKKLQISALTAKQIKALSGIDCLGGYKIVYPQLNNKNGKSFYRVKLFHEEAKKNPLRKSEKEIKKTKYWQPSNSLPHLYFNPLANWNNVAKDIAKPIIITEGEKKALKATQEGFTTIALGGVYSFKCKRLNQSLIDDFNLINWQQREVTIIYDSDLLTNPMVRQAQLELAEQLTELGAFVHIGQILPDNINDKMGLDDMFVKYGKKTMDRINRIEVEQCAKLYAMNDELAYIENPSSLYLINKKQFITPNLATTLHFANQFYTTTKNDKLVKKPVIKDWLEWTHRRTHNAVEYAPGQPRVIPDNNNLNLWHGWGVEPAKGTVRPFLNLLDHIFADNHDFKKWFLQWLAYPIQNPGYKMLNCVLLWSLQTGTGKSFIGYIMGDLYGRENFSVVDQEQLHSSFNDWAAHKQFILGEEITGVERRKDADRIKNMITRETITVNKKFQPAYTIKDCANYLFTSNHPDAFMLERHDRRFAVHEIKTDRQSADFYRKVDKWRREGGVSALHHYLLTRVNCSNFNPYDESIFTDDKQNMIDLSMSDVDMFCELLAKDPKQVLLAGGEEIERDLYTLEELLNFYDPQQALKTSRIALSKSLRRAGIYKCKVTSTASGSKNLFAVRNVDYWKRATHSERAGHYDNTVIVLSQAKSIRAKRKFT